ncbi:hypothetical protein BSL78_04923 [Apostichopus japonicus]|uniref:Plasminogen receptor (KT) n=1 Tax=Stichopus japonicus TaxID=307972 RepID=A0A2G8LD57_STIJA|nr:hypothetical protein BSL78_04923 [Apostichopus japonicus]
MGGLMSQAMEESFKKNKEFMTENQQIMLERQIQMQNQMREKGMAMQLSGSRELFNWYASFYGIASLAMVLGFARSKNPGVLVPFLPLSFVVGYQYDWCYGNKVERIRGKYHIFSVFVAMESLRQPHKNIGF